MEEHFDFIKGDQVKLEKGKCSLCGCLRARERVMLAKLNSSAKTEMLRIHRNTSVTEAKQGREREIENEALIMGGNLLGVL